MTAVETILELHDVKVWFGGVHAVDGVDMRLDAGKLYGIIGPNGSGKTTLINAISRLTSLTDGRISFAGEDISHAAPHVVARAGMSRTFQAIRLLPTLDVRDNIRLGTDHTAVGEGLASRNRAVRAAAHKRVNGLVDDAIERLGLESVARTMPSELPYGTQRRVEIARAVASGCQLLLLDEPIAGMSRTERDEIAETLLKLRSEGLTQVLIEHDLRMVLQVCDYVYVLNLGRNLADGLPAATVALPSVQQAYLGRTHAVT